MDLIPVKDERYSEYEGLLLERDRYRKEAGLAQRAYTREFGDLIAEVFKEKIACIERKKALAYCIAYRNRGETVDIDRVKEQIKTDMKTYREKLDSMLEENRNSKNCRSISERDFLLIRKIYRRVAKKLHPDLNPLTAKREELSRLWNELVTAYRCNDLKGIEEIEVLVERALAQSGADCQKIAISDIDEKIEALYKEIEKITGTDPYRYMDLLSDPELVREKKRALDEEREEYRNYAKQLEHELRKFMSDGGKLKWMIKPD